MSGDVQPRKRKEKRRRKDDIDPVPVQVHPPVFAPSSATEDVNIHVHKESGTGGNICAKLVFFVLFSALAVLIGLIITEHRGLTDLDSVESESRYSHIFEGLVDTGLHGHEDHEDNGSEEALNSREVDQVDDHDNEEELDVSELEEEEETPSEEDDKSGEAHSEELSVEDSRADETEEENESAVSEEQDEEIQNDEDEEIQNDEDEEIQNDEDEEIQNDEDEDDIPAEDDEEIDESDEYYQDEQQNSEEDNEKQNEVETKGVDEAEGDESDEGNDEETENNAGQVEDDDEGIEGNVNDEADENEVDEEDDLVIIKNKMDRSDDDVEQATSAQDISDETRYEEDLDHSSEKKEIVENVVEQKEAEGEEQSEKDDSVQESSVAVRLGVGIAILVVAHLVLVRKWRTADDSKPPISNERNEAVPDLSRRNTIVLPPNYQEIEPDIENDEEDYSEELSENEDPIEENRATCPRYLTPDSDPDHEKSPKPYEYEDEDDSIEEEEEINEDDYEIEDVDEDDDDEELLKRLEAKYGKLHGGGESPSAESWKRINFRQDMVDDSDFDSDRQSDDGEYQNMNITNKDDFQIRNEIDEAQKSAESNPSYAMKLFDAILRKNPSSPRSLYGKAVCLDALADEKQSNAILEKALAIYRGLLEREDVPPILYRLVTDRCIKRMRFIGQYKNLLTVHMQAIKRFPDDPKFRNELAVTYLTINRIENARSVLKQILSRWPNDGYALVHYGFILKTTDNNLEEAVQYLSEGLKTREEGVEDGRFYFQLGDALTRLGRIEEANEVYEKGAQNKVFLSKYQRSLYNVPRLTGNPWWQKENIQNPLLVHLLEQYWEEIRREGLSILNSEGYFRDESENLRDTGDWKQFELYARGRKNVQNCQKCPVTCSIIDRIPEAKFCKRGQTKFSVMHPGTHVWPHCGPTNCRLRTHLGLVVPPGTFLRVADETRSWDEGAVIVFDDSFEHEVWHNGTGIRLVLIVDVWHPELTPYERNNLSAI